MAEPSDYQTPPEPPRRRRSARMWVSLLVVWTLGVMSFLIWSALIILLLIRLLA